MTARRTQARVSAMASSAGTPSIEASPVFEESDMSGSFTFEDQHQVVGGHRDTLAQVQPRVACVGDDVGQAADAPARVALAPEPGVELDVAGRERLVVEDVRAVGGE